MSQTLRAANPRLIFKQLVALTLAAAALLASAAAWADPPGRVGRIGESIGTVWVFDSEQGEWVAAERNRPLTSGDRLSAERDARAELQIGSATLRLDGGTEIEFSALDDERVRVHLHHGSVALRLRSDESAREFSVSTREGRFDPQRAGHFRIDQQDDSSFGGVIAGVMRFEAQDSALDLNTGQRAEFWNERGATHYSWAALPSDRFGDWVAQQDRQDERDARSRAYVSPEMTGAEDLDRYGDWDRHPEYGTLWLPRRVEPGWAPYRFGRWAYVQPWGWTWVDAAPWGFAPFHYGRWVWWRDRWGWAPGAYVARPVYAPALVAWIGGPSLSIGINLGIGPSVGWVPLSPREVYRPHYHVTNVYVTKINNPYRRWHPHPNQPGRSGPVLYANQGAPGGVTVVSQNVLRERRPVGNAVIAPVDSRTVERWRTQPFAGAARGLDRRIDNVVPPPPSSRVSVATGSNPSAVPAAPGTVRRTPWGQAAPSRADAQAATPNPRRDRVEQGDNPRGRPATAEPRDAAVAPSAERIVRTAPPAAQGTRATRQPREPDNRRSDPIRRGPPAQVVQPARAVQATPPMQAPPVAAPAVRAAPPAAVAGPAPAGAAPPSRDEPARGRGRAQREVDPRGDDRLPPAQSRLREQNR
jgi:hypothetical protein